LPEVLALADDDCRRRWESLSLGYTESQGLPALRERSPRCTTACRSAILRCTRRSARAITRSSVAAYSRYEGRAIPSAPDTRTSVNPRTGRSTWTPWPLRHNVHHRRQLAAQPDRRGLTSEQLARLSIASWGVAVLRRGVSLLEHGAHLFRQPRRSRAARVEPWG
jgi:hypothetical protein